jgi:hypothetical protein
MTISDTEFTLICWARRRLCDLDEPSLSHMVDFGSASHGDYFPITDTYDPLSNRRALYDTSQVPPAALLWD